MSRTGSNHGSNSVESMVEQGRIMGRIGSKHTSFWSTKLKHKSSTCCRPGQIVLIPGKLIPGKVEQRGYSHGPRTERAKKLWEKDRKQKQLKVTN